MELPFQSDGEPAQRIRTARVKDLTSAARPLVAKAIVIPVG